MENGVIYKIENPTGKIYIGKSVDFSSRLSAYRTLKCKDQQAIYNSLKKYGFDSHIITIIYQGPVDTLYEKEIKYIQAYNSFKMNNPNGLNLTKGGEGQLGYKQSLETIKKRVQAHIGAKRSEETKKLMSDSAKKRNPNFTGKTHSEETLKKMALRKTNKLQTKATIDLKRQTTSANRVKKFGNILQISLTGTVIKEWEPSFVKIAKEMNCDPTTIRGAVISNGEKVRLGYKWKYSKK
jgi:group I intron endonuclease